MNKGRGALVRGGVVVAICATALASPAWSDVTTARTSQGPVRVRTEANPGTEAANGPAGQYHTDIVEVARTNDAYRRVLFTGRRMQLALMSIPPESDIGSEAHARVEQMLVIVSGNGEAHVGSTSYPVHPGDVVIVEQGVQHDIVNTGRDPLRLYTVYAPPNHPPGTVHATREAAAGDRADEAYQHSVR